MPEGILTAAEIAEIKRECHDALLSYERMPYPTNGLRSIVVERVPRMLETIQALRRLPRILATIQALRGLLGDSLAVDELKSLLAEATEWGHTMNCWRTPCTCGYDKWMVKVKKILEGEGA